MIAAPGSTQAALAAKVATLTIPIVFGVAVDPVALGLVSSFSHPSSNATGIFFISLKLAAKRLGMPRELLPHATSFAALVNQHGPLTKTSLQDLEAGAAQLFLQVEILRADSTAEIDAAFAKVAEKNAALLVSPDTLFTDLRAQLVTLATRHAVPTIYPGAVARLVGIEVGVVSGVFNLELPCVSALGWRLRHEEAYHAA